MRIAISGTAAQGKTTLINDFLKKYPNYTTPKKTYRDVISTDSHSKSTNKDTQWDILNFMVDSLTEHGDKDQYVIHDRCPLDNIVYSLWAHAKGEDDNSINEKFIKKCIPLVRESMKFLDIIFFIPITNATEANIEDDKFRETDVEYIQEIDNLFKAMHSGWQNPESQFFPREDRPGMIEVFGNPEERIKMIGFYVNDDGDMYGDKDSMVNNDLYDQFGFPIAEEEESITWIDKETETPKTGKVFKKKTKNKSKRKIYE